jgi:hypothetical protein
MNVVPVFSLFAFILMLVLLPILFGELMATSLSKLHLNPEMALLLMMAIIIGGLVNIPVKRIAHERVVPMHPLAVFGLGRLWPGMVRERRETYCGNEFPRRASTGQGRNSFGRRGQSRLTPRRRAPADEARLSRAGGGKCTSGAPIDGTRGHRSIDNVLAVIIGNIDLLRDLRKG